MKKAFLLLFLSFCFMCSYAISRRTLKVGESTSLSVNNWNHETYDFLVSGNAIAVEYLSLSSSSITVRVHGISPGYGFFSGPSKNSGYIFHVVDVTDIKMPDNLSLSMGDSYTYTPIITDAEAETTLTWTSSNTSVATVDADGVVSTVGTGQTVITCKASNGVSALSVITVSPVLVSNVSLGEHEYQMNVGDIFQPTATVLPANASSTNVKWMSTNENIAQVDDDGKVTAIAPGYCSIYCIADDSNRKYDKCLVYVKGTAASRADVNNDGHVTVTDALSVIDVILNK